MPPDWCPSNTSKAHLEDRDHILQLLDVLKTKSAPETDKKQNIIDQRISQHVEATAVNKNTSHSDQGIDLHRRLFDPTFR